QSSTVLMNQAWALGEISVGASRCGVRNKIWATRLVGHVLIAINKLDPEALRETANLSTTDLNDRLDDGQQNALWSLQDHPDTFCAEKVTADRLAEADRIVADQAPVW